MEWNLVRPRFIAAAVVALLPAVAVSQSSAPRTTIDVARLGPQVGQLVPDFSLRDQTGRVWTRQSIAGPKGAILVFLRSADW
jgi:hypothetical protein